MLSLLISDGDYLVEFFDYNGCPSIRLYSVVSYYNPKIYKISDLKDIYSDYVAEMLSENIFGSEVYLSISKNSNGDKLLKWSDL